MATNPNTPHPGYSLLRCGLGRVTCRITRRLDRDFDRRVVCPTLPVAPVRSHRTGEKQGLGVYQKRTFLTHRIDIRDAASKMDRGRMRPGARLCAPPSVLLCRKDDSRLSISMGDNPHLMPAARRVGTKDSKALAYRQIVLPGVACTDFAPITRSMSRKKLKSLPICRIRAAFEHQRSAGGYPDHTDLVERHILYPRASSLRASTLP
jgi:hypothetical protein